jgi:hypothetical protein
MHGHGHGCGLGIDMDMNMDVDMAMDTGTRNESGHRIYSLGQDHLCSEVWISVKT